MTISIGATVTIAPNDTNSTGFTVEHTVDAGTDLLVVLVNGNDTSDADSVVSSVSWNTTEDLSPAVARARSAEWRDFSHFWVLAVPTATTADIIVTMAGTNTDCQREC